MKENGRSSFYNALPQPAANLDTASTVIFSERIPLIVILSL
jgi:hypothetical protein